jgi:NAD(P)-dependent dehydrogenase (short-subunit alcohol dehydrogenase family)
MVDLTETSTLVTGGASGLGRATAEALVSRSAFVTIVNQALDLAERSGPLRAAVHCAGHGARARLPRRWPPGRDRSARSLTPRRRPA